MNDLNDRYRNPEPPKTPEQEAKGAIDEVLLDGGQASVIKMVYAMAKLAGVPREPLSTRLWRWRKGIFFFVLVAVIAGVIIKSQIDSEQRRRNAEARTNANR